jgi:hypothetical protein
VAFVSAALPAESTAVAAIAPLPTVEPVPDNGNLPLNSALYSGSMDYGDLARQGYVEREYYFSGKASTRDQESGAVLQADLPYVSRMVVRMPLNPKDFSGNVIIEPFHGQRETAIMWTQLHRYLTRHGDAWVGFTVKAYSLDMDPQTGYNVGGIPMLKAYDAVRYGRLDLAPDMRPLTPPPPPKTPPQALDLLTQVAALLKSNDPASPLKGFTVRKLFAVGNGMSGEVVAGYVRTGQDQAWQLPTGGQIIDGYLFNNMTRLPPKPPKNAALVMVRSEHEIERAAFLGFIGQTANNDSYRVYNVPGTAHLGTRDTNDSTSGAHQMNAILPKPEANLPWVVDATSCPNLNDEPAELFLAAVLSRMELWGKNGTALPVAPDPETLPGDPGTPMGDPTSFGPFNPPKKVALVKRDPMSGNVLGGVRMPWVAAPVALFLSSVASQAPGAAKPSLKPADAWPRESKDIPKAARPSHGGACILENPRQSYDTAKLKQLYKSYADYEQKFSAAKALAVKQGWLLREDADTLRPRGDPANF